MLEEILIAVLVNRLKVQSRFPCSSEFRFLVLLSPVTRDTEE